MYSEKPGRFAAGADDGTSWKDRVRLDGGYNGLPGAVIGHELGRQERAPPFSSHQPPNGEGWKSHHSAGGLLPNPTTSENPSLLSSLVSKWFSSPAPSPRRHSFARPATPPPAASVGSPSTILFILLCSLWYLSSAMSSNTGKSIMLQFRYPVTLTFVQFGFVAGYCLLFMNPWWGMAKLRPPTVHILQNTLPMAVFQVGGHIFSSMAISRVPVATVHTIKALSPMFTVAAYALLFGVRYSSKTYTSLLPLTLGVMLACSFDLSLNNAIGITCAFGSALVFVTSNIFFKKIMPSPSASGGALGSPGLKLDKLNLLFYSSGLAFLLMIPIWLWSDLSRLMSHTHHAIPTNKPPPTHSVTYYFFMNGTVHFAQNIIAFAILSMTSPVTYSIASLIKRIAVICIAIVWFNQTVHPVQAFGICLTFVGLWMYNAAKGDVERGENKMRLVEARREFALPSTNTEAKALEGSRPPSPHFAQKDQSYQFSSALRHPHVVSNGHPNNGSYTSTKSTPRDPPPRLDLSLRSVKHHSGSLIGEPYPSPPASIDSPTQQNIPMFVQ